jgi:hypothetical protein
LACFGGNGCASPHLPETVQIEAIRIGRDLDPFRAFLPHGLGLAFKLFVREAIKQGGIGEIAFALAHRASLAANSNSIRDHVDRASPARSAAVRMTLFPSAVARSSTVSVLLPAFARMITE